ncbi:MAG TPA: DUF6220 domain-containing protein [Gaiellaceae bacterium]|nr:DUF6220 domain-containing protein [Gaiellaceae bacterium]
MEGVRKVAYQVYRVLIAFVAVACVVQIFLAGRGVFGIHGSASLDDQKSLDLHRNFGEVIALVTVLTFLLALLMWDKRLILWTFVLAFLAEVIQHATALPKHPWISGFHPVGGVAVLGLSAWLAHSAWAGKGKARQVSATVDG